MSTRVAAIIPAYNEEATVARVVLAARQTPKISEVIVVSDGSTDATAHLARQAGAHVVDLSSQSGKGRAMLAGVEATDADLVMFLDADLLGLAPRHLHLLLEPVLSGHCAMSVGVRDRGWISRWIVPYLPLVSGERVLSRDLFLSLPIASLDGYRVEVALNAACRARRGRICTVFFPGVHIRTKISKVGWRRGLSQYVRMWLQVLHAFFL